MIRSMTLSFAMVIAISSQTEAQGPHPLEPAKNHYKEFEKIDAKPNPDRADLDEIRYPSDKYNSGSLVYLLVLPEYLTEKQLHELKLSVAPPANSSDQTLAELEYLLEWQNQRTEEQEKRAAEVLAPIGYWPHIHVINTHSRYQRNLEDLFFEGREVLGEHCSPEKYPATLKLLAGVTKDVRIMEFTVKYHLLRPRPYQLSEDLKPMAVMSTPSFASGHTLWAYIQAYVWSELVPDKRKEFLDLAYEVGESREIMGIHYPSDEEAARVLAHRMLTKMFDNPRFREDLANAKREWKKQ